MDKDEVECCDEDVLKLLDEGVVKCLDKNNKDKFDVAFLLEKPLEYLIDETLGGKFLVYYGYMKKIGWSDTYAHFYH